MRAIFALSLLSAALICAPQVLSAAPAEATPESQKTQAVELQRATGPAAPAAPKQVCPGNPDPLGVARVVEIDTTGGPGFGFQNYKEYDFLQPKEVVLTFDDGPLPGRTTGVLAALEAQCTKATFFSVGKVAGGYPEILRDVAKAGHTIGAHTVNHKDLSKMKFDEAKDEIERSFSIVHRAVGGPTAPFFRFPFLRNFAGTVEVPRRPQHRRVFDRHRHIRFQGSSARSACEARNGIAGEARQRHHPDARHPAAHCRGSPGDTETAESKGL